MLFMVSSTYASETYFYKRYEEKSGRLVDNSKFIIDTLDDGRGWFIWDNTNESAKEISEYFYNIEGMCTEWGRIFEAEGTNFKVINSGKELAIKGTLKGKEVDKSVKYDKYQYFANPKIELMRFIKSGDKKVKFWTLRSDTLQLYQMVAQNKGIDTVSINGTTTRAYRIDWGPDLGMLSKYFNRIYWFRESDLIFVKQTGSNKYVRELIPEITIN